jgi:acetoin:2,6-dichlorophenolindophenol oxidoreductase subunit beta
MKKNMNYAQGILDAYHHLLANHPEVFVIGQGLWSPWYVGTTMTDLDKVYGKERVIDCPVSELATTGAALGAALSGFRPIIVHPRMDFMVLAIDQIVGQAANWFAMFGGQINAPVTVRAIINRGGEQGAQHSQALHAWFAHVPGLRVVMPATAKDARDLFVASVLSDSPVLYIDDRWLYETTEEVGDVEELSLSEQRPQVLREGSDCTLVGVGFTTHLCRLAAEILAAEGINCEVIDLRIINPFHSETIVESVKKTGRLCAVDGGWQTCGVAGEVVASAVENVLPSVWKNAPNITQCTSPYQQSLRRYILPKT